MAISKILVTFLVPMGETNLYKLYLLFFNFVIFFNVKMHELV